MKTVAIIKEVNETELVATWTPHDIEVKVGDWLEIKSEWQGLSDDEIDKLPFYDYMTQEEVNNVVCVIEQALKEKNHG